VRRGRPTRADYAAAIHAALEAARWGDAAEARAMIFTARVLAPHVFSGP
jgi:hypothetical protein